MFKKEYLISYIKWGLLAALAFCIPMIYFIYSANYANTYLLFIGNILLLLVIAAYILNFNKTKGQDGSAQTMIAAGHSTTIFAIVFSLVVAFISLMIFEPDLLGSGPDKVLANAPAVTGNGKTHGLVFMLFMNTIIGNFIAGSFPSIILSYTAKRNQTKDRKSEVLNN